MIVMGQKKAQPDPCDSKSKNQVVADVTYCDRYWECVDGKAENFDCPNGLVFAGRSRGILENCDYPWRSDVCEDKTLASKLSSRPIFKSAISTTIN